jgi:hypothetical protein
MNTSTERIGESAGLLFKFLSQSPNGHALISDIEITRQNSRHIAVSIEIFDNLLSILPDLKRLKAVIGNMKMNSQKPDRSFFCLNVGY